MNRLELIKKLLEHGIDQQTSKDLFLYYLTTEDRQEQMYEWLNENPDICDKDAIINEAQQILSGYLAKNPYNRMTRDLPIPKWTPPAPVNTSPAKKTVIQEPENTKKDEDPFDKVLQAFFSKMDWQFD